MVKDQGANQRQKAQNWKNEVNLIDKVLSPKGKAPKIELPMKVESRPLTEENLLKLSERVDENPQLPPISHPPPPVKKAKVVKKHTEKKPLWALTQDEAENMEEREVDELLEFAYELDYEKYMEDLEVRQALAVLKSRVKDLKQDENWKDEFAENWNQDGEKAEKEDAKSVISEAPSHSK